MSEPIHAHKIFEIIDAHSYTCEELRSAVIAKFGLDAQFTKCSGDIYSVDEILEFFFDAGKVIEKEEKLKLNRGKVCSD